MKIALRPALASLLVLSLLLVGCTGKKGSSGPANPPAGQAPAKENKYPELVEPFDLALRALITMNQHGQTKNFVESEKAFLEFRRHWAVIRKVLQPIDPKLEVHLEDGAVELDIEFRKPTEQIRVYEIDEETVKLGRLLGKAADLLGVPVNRDLIQVDPREEIPYNSTKTITITMTDHKFSPNVIEVEQHTRVTFKLVNRGKEMHEFELGYYAVEVEDIEPGQTAEMTLTMLDAGEFEFSCHVPGHYEVGMFGTIKVKPAELKKQ